MSGLVTMTPSSIDHVGTSASINANGGVDFTGVTSLSLDGVFQGGDDGFDNYVVMCHGVGSAETVSVDLWYRANGNDAKGVDYTRQQLRADAGTVAGDRPPTATSTRQLIVSSTALSAVEIYFYGPSLPKPTASRSVSVMGRNGARIYDHAATHSQPVSYDGFTLTVLNTDTMTGNLIVMGYAE